MVLDEYWWLPEKAVGTLCSAMPSLPSPIAMYPGYARSAAGEGQCPAGSNPISNAEDCAAAVVPFKYVYESTAFWNSSVRCQWCGGCNPKTATLALGAGGPQDRWLCQGDCSSFCRWGAGVWNKLSRKVVKTRFLLTSTHFCSFLRWTPFPPCFSVFLHSAEVTIFEAISLLPGFCFGCVVIEFD